MTEYSVPAASEGSAIGFTNRDAPGAMTRVSVVVFVPSRLTKRAVTFAFNVPRFCTTKVVSHPDASFATYGSASLCAPAVRPTYDSASAVAPEPWCSFTTATISDPNERTTTANCVSPGRSTSLFGTSAKLRYGCSAEMRRQVMSAPSPKR